jgi:pilus assembly protein CpaF
VALDRVISKTAARTGGGDTASAEDQYSELLKKVQDRLTGEVSLKGLDPEAARKVAADRAWTMLDEELERGYRQLAPSSEVKRQLLDRLLQMMFGFGVLEPFIHDPTVTEIMVNGTDRIYIEQHHKLQLARDASGNPLTFPSDKEALRVIQRIVAPINRKVDESDPVVDARLPNGSRVCIVLPPVALDGPSITIRKFPDRPYTMDDLVRFGSVPQPVADLLSQLVQARYNLVISGGTGSGKTTFLNALSMFIPPDQRLVTIEDAAELKLAKAENIVRMETRPANVEGRGAIAIRDLVKAALRMRPDRIIVGEVRGGEALDMLQAMNTGHDGSLTTGHANSAQDMLSRLETMVLGAGAELPLPAIRAQISSAVDLIVHIAKLRDGGRRMVQLTEILELRGDQLITQNLLALQRGPDGQYRLAPTGNRLARTDKLEMAGLEVPDGSFGLNA